MPRRHPHPEVRAQASLEGPTNADLVAAIRELLEAFSASTEEGPSEERCFLALDRQRELLDQVDAARRGGEPVEPSAIRLN